MQTTESATPEAMETINNQPERAEQSCKSCKRLKRRCSKDMPSCQLCIRVGRRCDYTSSPSTPTRSETEVGSERTSSRNLTPRSINSGSNILSNSTIPHVPSDASSDLASCFLDSVATRGMDVSSPCTLLWRDVGPSSDDISKEEAIAITDRYFNTTHSWLPISMFFPVRWIEAVQLIVQYSIKASSRKTDSIP